MYIVRVYIMSKIHVKQLLAFKLKRKYFKTFSVIS